MREILIIYSYLKIRTLVSHGLMEYWNGGILDNNNFEHL